MQEANASDGCSECRWPNARCSFSGRRITCCWMEGLNCVPLQGHGAQCAAIRAGQGVAAGQRAARASWSRRVAMEAHPGRHCRRPDQIDFQSPPGVVSREHSLHLCAWLLRDAGIKRARKFPKKHVRQVAAQHAPHWRVSHPQWLSAGERRLSRCDQIDVSASQAGDEVTGKGEGRPGLACAGLMSATMNFDKRL